MEQDYAYVIHGDFVSMEDGSGIVHIAPAFGADDMDVGMVYKLPVLQTVAPDGAFIDAVTPWAGVWVKDADPQITQELTDRGLLYRAQLYEHNYPFCWRCHTPLLYYARSTWYIEATRYRQKMIDLNQTINWVPDHIKDGRFGNWLDDLRDWALGRERYWGTPLPVWKCDNPDCNHMHCVGGVAELEQLTGRDLSELDLHRPYVDEVTFPCSECGGTMQRVPELIDVWFDSGAMGVAQWGYPYQNQEKFKEQFPADYICEAVDQTRGWFYSQHAIATMLFESVNFKNCICLGHDPGRRRAEDVQEQGQHRRTLERVEQVRGGCVPLVHVHRRAARRAAPLLGGTGGRGREEFLADALERVQLFRDLRQYRRVRSASGALSRWPSAIRWTAGF